MDLADLGTVQVLDLLSPMDEIGVFAVDTAPHEIVPLDTVEHNIGYRSKILAIGSEGGGIYIYEALVASARMIQNAHAQTKHIILFSDAADAEQSAHYEDIVAKLRDADVTVSVVGLGTEHDCDANMLKDLARRGGGDCYFSDNPDEIPRIFAQDTFTIARSMFDDPGHAISRSRTGYSPLGSRTCVAPPPSLGGYNLCYVRPLANLAAVTGDEYQAPVVASWNAGNGRVLCYLGEADGKYSGDFAKWNQTGEFYSTLARWVAGKHQSLPDDMLLSQEVRDGVFCAVAPGPRAQGRSGCQPAERENPARPAGCATRQGIHFAGLEKCRSARSSHSDCRTRNGVEHRGNFRPAARHPHARVPALLSRVRAGPARTRRGGAGANRGHHRRQGPGGDSQNVGRTARQIALCGTRPVVAGGGGHFIPDGNF